MDVKLIERFQYLARDHGSGMLRHADMFGQAAAAGIADNARIAELTAERDAALTMVADLASELESELDAKGIYDTPRKMVRNRQTVVQARALLEGSKP